MGLKLYYKEDDQFFEITSGQDKENPLTTIHDGKKGSISTKQIYLRNDDATKWYSSIIVVPRDTVDANPYGDIAFNETGWGVKLSEGSSEPSTSEWEDLAWGNDITIEDIGSDSGADTTTYTPFWYYVTCPPNTNAQIKTDIVVNVSYTENTVV